MRFEECGGLSDLGNAECGGGFLDFRAEGHDGLAILDVETDFDEEAGSSMAARIAIMAITTRSSIRVKVFLLRIIYLT